MTATWHFRSAWRGFRLKFWMTSRFIRKQLGCSLWISMCDSWIVMNSFLVHNSQSLADALRSLDFQQWVAMLQKVFSACLNVLRRMQVSITAISVSQHFPHVATSVLIPAELAFRCYIRVLYVCWWSQQGELNLSQILMMQKASTYLNLILTSWNQSGKMSCKNYFLSDKLREIRDEDDYMRLNIWVNCTTKNEREWDLCSQSRKTT